MKVAVLIEIRDDDGRVVDRRAGIETIPPQVIKMMEGMCGGDAAPFIARDALQHALSVAVAVSPKHPSPANLLPIVEGVTGSNDDMGQLFASVLPAVQRAAKLADADAAALRLGGSPPRQPQPQAPQQMTPAAIDPMAIYRRE